MEADVQHEAVVVELDPKGHKRDLLMRHIGLTRFVWNWTLRQHMDNGWPVGGKAGAEGRKAYGDALDRGEKPKLPKKISAAEMSRRWTREVDGVAPWARELARSTVTYAIRAVDDAYKHAFRRCKAGDRSGFPRFRGRQHPHRAFTMQDQSFRHTRWAIKLGKIGMVPIRNARRHDPLDRLEGARLLRIVVSQRAGRFFASLMVERPRAPVVPPMEHVLVGIDLGHQITCSDGRIYTPPRPLAALLRWIQHWGKAMDRRKSKDSEGRHSRRWLKAKQTVQRLHLRAAFLRKNWLHQVTTDLSRRYTTIVVEGFDVGAFVEHGIGHRKGRRDALDIGWGMFRTILAYKMERAGRCLVQIGKHEATDQSCSRCGEQDPRRDGLFRCPSCDHVDIRPRNTAELLERIGRGDPPSRLRPRGGSPAGEAGVNTRGAGKASGRRLRSETEHRSAQGGTASQVPHLSTAEKARKAGGPPRPKARATQRPAKAKRTAARSQKTRPLKRRS